LPEIQALLPIKATYFAVMASFTNLALALGALASKYLNHFYVVTRQVIDPLTGAVTIPADYSRLGALLITVSLIGLILPILTVLLVQKSSLRST
jgi:hypothetical protein